MEKENLIKCCRSKKEYHGKNLFKAISYALIPHIGCILFIIASIFGTTVLMQYFKPLLMSRNIFYYLILASVSFATMSSFFYLKKNNSLSFDGLKKKKGYLSVMYGTTVGINILLFFFIFPFFANFAFAGAVDFDKDFVMNINVDIPCSGHAPLISSEVFSIEGVSNVEYSFPNNFQIYYKSDLKNKILSLDVFNEYPAIVVLKRD